MPTAFMSWSHADRDLGGPWPRPSSAPAWGPFYGWQRIDAYQAVASVALFGVRLALILKSPLRLIPAHHRSRPTGDLSRVAGGLPEDGDRRSGRPSWNH